MADVPGELAVTGVVGEIMVPEKRSDLPAAPGTMGPEKESLVAAEAKQDTIRLNERERKN
jgi:hypothetical protein